MDHINYTDELKQTLKNVEEGDSQLQISPFLDSNVQFHFDRSRHSTFFDEG